MLRNGHWTNLHMKTWDGSRLRQSKSYSPRVCATRALKIRNAVELVSFLQATLNPVANIEKNSIECETQQRWNCMSKSPSSTEKPKSARTPAAEPESQALGKKSPWVESLTIVLVSQQRTRSYGWHHSHQHQFSKGGRKIVQNRNWKKHAQSDVKVTLCTGNEEENLPTPRKFWLGIYLAVNYLSSGTLTNEILRCWADGGFETLKAHPHPRLIAVVCFCFESLYCPNAWPDWLNALEQFEKAAISSCTRQLVTTKFINIHRICKKYTQEL